MYFANAKRKKFLCVANIHILFNIQTTRSRRSKIDQNRGLTGTDWQLFISIWKGQKMAQHQTPLPSLLKWANAARERGFGAPVPVCVDWYPRNPFDVCNKFSCKYWKQILRIRRIHLQHNVFTYYLKPALILLYISWTKQRFPGKKDGLHSLFRILQ